MERYTMLAEDILNSRAIITKHGRTKDRSLGDITVQLILLRSVPSDNYKLLTSIKVGSHPLKSLTSDTEVL